MLKALRHSYRQMFGRYLLLTNTVSSGALLAVGDLTVQSASNAMDKNKDQPSKIDWRRTTRMLTIGMALGPISHVWYKYLDLFLPHATTSVVAKKIFLDQVVGSPLVTYLFFTGSGLMEGKDMAHTWIEFRNKFVTVYKADWCFWPPVQFVNFYFLHPKFRVIYVCFASLAWSTFLSFAKHTEIQDFGKVATTEDNISITPSNTQTKLLGYDEKAKVDPKSEITRKFP